MKSNLSKLLENSVKLQVNVLQSNIKKLIML